MCKGTLRRMMGKWQHWHVGFSHFVQLCHEPTKSDLWVLLSRRAADISHRAQNSAYLFIPIFSRQADSTIGSSLSEPPQVSVIIVQVKIRADSDCRYPFASSERLYPGNGFSGSNGLHQKSPHNVVRIHMEMSGVQEPCRYVCVDSSIPERSDNQSASEASSSHAIYIGGVGPYNSQGIRGEVVAVVSADVAKQLNLLLSPWWDSRNLVAESFDGHERLFADGEATDGLEYVLPNQAVQEMANAALPEPICEQLGGENGDGSSLQLDPERDQAVGQKRSARRTIGHRAKKQRK